MRYHLIAIGGSVMHNVAIDLKDMGHYVTGSDDEIYEPSKSRLKDKGLLPENTGWHPDSITDEIDVIILGKHARSDNPELIKARELNIPILSFPEFIAQNAKASKRISIAGSHGKTSTTAMILHVLRKQSIDCDYLVGATIKGFEKMVRLSGSDILIVEADEYPSSCLDNRAKMLHYNSNIAVITGIAWDHVNIYKSYEEYKQIFIDFLNQMPVDSVCYFDQTDEELLGLMIHSDFKCKRQSYLPLNTNTEGNVVRQGKTWPISVFGKHNLLNMRAAMLVCQELGVSETDFLEDIADFTGADKRMEIIFESDELTVIKDFAHAPSKCQATVQAVRERFPDRQLTAILELHTFSSLSPDFIPQYKDTMAPADKAYVLYDPHAVKMKKMPVMDNPHIKSTFGDPGVAILNTRAELQEILNEVKEASDAILLIMTSGNLAGLDIKQYFSRPLPD